MKKLLLLTTLLMMSLQTKAQLALSLLDDTPIADGRIFTYNSANYPGNTLYYKIKNTSANAINVRFKIIGLVNNTGSGFQVCYDPNCIPFVSLNQIFPALTHPAIYVAGNGSTVGDGYNMANYDAGDGVNYPMDHVVKFYMVDESENEIGNSVTITYRYDPNSMAVSNVNAQNEFAKVLNTKIGNTVLVTSKVKANYQMYNVEGKLISSGSINTGENRIEVATLKTGMYFITISDNNGNTVKTKLIK